MMLFRYMVIKDHSQLSDEEYEQQFERCTFKPKLFTHEAHLRLAYIHITKYGREAAENNMCKQIKEYAEYFGATDKFNKTVTIASVKTMHHFMRKSGSSGFRQLMEQYPQIISDFKGLLGKHYSYNVFGDKEAKKEFKEPDLLPFEGK